jgi:DNA-binding LacI/PurR family transcriptional regulator
MKELYGVSVTTVRRAISRLADEGWVTVRNGLGMYVKGHPDVRITRSKNIAVMFAINAEIVARVQERALGAGYLVSTFPRAEMGWDPAAERVFFEHIRGDRHHALLAFCTPTEPRNDDLLKVMADEGMRILHVEHYRDELPDQNFILPDYRRAGWLCVEHFLNEGYRNLRIARLPDEWPGARLLEHGFVEAVRHYHGQSAGNNVVMLYPNKVGNYLPATQAAQELVRGLPTSTGLLCTSLSVAKGIGEFAQEAGRQCPGDIGVIGTPYMDYHKRYEGIDTVEFDWVTYLLNALDRVMAPDWPEIREWVPPRLVRRGTT